jgi:hypothetical protein
MALRTRIGTTGVVTHELSLGDSTLAIDVPTTFTTGVTSRQYFTGVGSGTFEVAEMYLGTMFEVDPNSGSTSITLPASIATGFNASVSQIGSGSVSFAAVSGSTVQSVTGSTPRLRVQWSSATIHKRNSTMWIVAGDIT